MKKTEKLQYRTDIKAVMCKGIPDEEANTIKRALQLESTVFGLSRLYVPLSFYSLYRRGVFLERFTFGEFKYLARVIIMMHVIDCTGHILMRKWTEKLYEKHIGFGEENFYSKKKQWDDYAIQKNYFRNKKEGKSGNA